jgi:hypothetical protein
LSSKFGPTQKVYANVYRLPRKIGISNNFSNETETAGYDC